MILGLHHEYSNLLTLFFKRWLHFRMYNNNNNNSDRMHFNFIGSMELVHVLRRFTSIKFHIIPQMMMIRKTDYCDYYQFPYIMIIIIIVWMNVIEWKCSHTNTHICWLAAFSHCILFNSGINKLDVLVFFCSFRRTQQERMESNSNFHIAKVHEANVVRIYIYIQCCVFLVFVVSFCSE